MASRRHSTTIENLPGEVLSEIFIRLLAKQLSQMRSVCKPWNALLSESSFINSHLHHSIHYNDKILLFFRQEHSRTSFTARPSRSPNLKSTNDIKLLDTLQRKYVVIGSVNGLVCFFYVSNFGEVICVWNPSLSAMLTVPQSSVTSHDIGFGNGFGYDPKTDAYKIVNLTSAVEPDVVPQAEVYSMRKGSWKLISQRFPSYISCFCVQINVCVDGRDGYLHWVCHTDMEQKSKTIVAFDLAAETFSEVPLPDSILVFKVNQFSCVLGVLHGKLCVMSSVDGKSEVWLMDEYGVAESWVKHHAFSQFSGGITPYGFTSHNEFLFKVDDRFTLYDPVSAKTKIFKIVFRKCHLRNVVEYVDSLVWIEPPERLQK